MAPLDRGFFIRDTLVVARELLGQRLVRILNGQRVSGRVVEVEAYVGERDQACHARSGRTARNASMYGSPGHAYVYFVYGMHYCFNVVTDREAFPAAVLVRALEPLEGIKVMRELRWPESGTGRSARRSDDVLLTSGPARLCQALAVDRDLDGADLCVPTASLFFERDDRVPEGDVLTGPRIGVRGDNVALMVPWRLCIRDNRFVSR
jgi:DNA-3-methyladenine glycosylase